MSKQAPAVVFVEPNRVELWDMEIAEPGPLDVGIRTVFSGISQGTERLSLSGLYNQMGENIPTFYPCSPGYQAAGVIDIVGEKVRDLKVGDLVFAQGTRFSDTSWKYPGPCMASHAGYIVAHRDSVTPLPPDVDMAGASLYQMAAVSFHGTRLANISAGELVVVLGQGVIGQMSAQAARLKGARVITADIIPLRVELSGRYSSDRAVNVAEENITDVVLTESLAGADVVIDTTGSARLVAQCVELVRREGRICLQGYYPEKVTFDFHSTHLKRLTVVFPCGWDNEEQTHLSEHLLAGRIKISPLITHRVPYREAAQAYKWIMEEPEQSLGIVLDWSKLA